MQVTNHHHKGATAMGITATVVQAGGSTYHVVALPAGTGLAGRQAVWGVVCWHSPHLAAGVGGLLHTALSLPAALRWLARHAAGHPVVGHPTRLHQAHWAQHRSRGYTKGWYRTYRQRAAGPYRTR